MATTKRTFSSYTEDAGDDVKESYKSSATRATASSSSTSKALKWSSVDVEGPILYAYFQFEMNGKTKRVHAFGDRHVNETSCAGKDPISIYNLIVNTLQHYPDRTIDVFAEIGFGLHEFKMKGKRAYPAEPDAYIHYLFRQFEKDGCFRRARDARCKRKYGEHTRFHNIDLRSSLMVDVAKYLDSLRVPGAEPIEARREAFMKFYEKRQDLAHQRTEKKRLENVEQFLSLPESQKMQFKRERDGSLVSAEEQKQVLVDLDREMVDEFSAVKLAVGEIGEFMSYLKQLYQHSQDREAELLQSYLEHNEPAQYKAYVLAHWVNYLLRINLEEMSELAMVLVTYPQNLNNVEVMLAFTYPWRTANHFYSTLLYSIRRERELWNPTADPNMPPPYYEYVLMKTAEKIGQPYVEYIAKMLGLIRAAPKPGSPLESFMQASFPQRLSAAAVAVPLTTLFLDHFVVMRLLKPFADGRDADNVIEYVGAGHIMNQRAILVELAKHGIIENLQYVMRGNETHVARPYSNVAILKELTNQCVAVTTRLDTRNGEHYLSFDITDQQMQSPLFFVPGVALSSPILPGRIPPIGLGLDDEFTEEEYGKYREMSEEKQAEYLTTRATRFGRSTRRSNRLNRKKSERRSKRRSVRRSNRRRTSRKKSVRRSKRRSSRKKSVRRSKR